MRTLKKVPLELVRTEYIPETLEPGKMYYSEKYNVTNHLCPCGCGTQTPLPIKSGELGILISGDRFTISPSVWHRYGCKSHYVINNSIVSIIE